MGSSPPRPQLRPSKGPSPRGSAKRRFHTRLSCAQPPCRAGLWSQFADKEIRVSGGQQPPPGKRSSLRGGATGADPGQLPAPSHCPLPPAEQREGHGYTSLGRLLAVAQLPADILQPPLELLLLLLSQLLLRLGRLLLPARGCGRARELRPQAGKGGRPQGQPTRIRSKFISSIASCNPEVFRKTAFFGF